MRRRTLLTVVGAGSLSIAGCIALPGSDGRETLPDDCPTSRDVGIEWPRDLGESTVATFVERYEETYYRQHVIDTIYEPESRLFGYSGWISRIKNVSEVDGGGWRVHFSGIVNVQRGDLVLEATVTEPPDEEQVIPFRDVADELLFEVLNTAAETGQEARRIGPTQSEGYLQRFEEFSSEFEISEVGDSDTLYFSVDGTIVELVVHASPPNRDHFWDAWYYVDEHVAWRSGDADTDPREGDLLECRDDDRT